MDARQGQTTFFFLRGLLIKSNSAEVCCLFGMSNVETVDDDFIAGLAGRPIYDPEMAADLEPTAISEDDSISISNEGKFGEDLVESFPIPGEDLRRQVKRLSYLQQLRNMDRRSLWMRIIAVGILVILGGTGIYLLWRRFFSCANNIDVSHACRKDCDCKNQACGRETAADGAPLVCCPSGATTNYAFFDYCKGMPDDAVCWSNAMCESGYCRDNGGGTRKGKCGKGKVADQCGVNKDCANGACGRATAADGTKLTCCPSGKVSSYGGFDYCTDMPDESVCWSNAQCASGFCRDNGGGFRKGKCGKGAPTDKCGVNGDCANGACGREGAASGTPLTCCKSGKVGTFGGYDYCLEQPDGAQCWSDAQCLTGNCKGNAGGTRKGVCGGTAVNDSCKSDGDCANKACGRSTAADGAPLVCCPTGKSFRYGGFDYCGDLPASSVCWSDAHCATGLKCAGNLGGLRKGSCQTK